MRSPEPDVLDFALTNDMDAEQAKAPSTLVIALNDKTTINVRRTFELTLPTASLLAEQISALQGCDVALRWRRIAAVA